MTPLAQRIARELTLPVRERTFDDKAGVLKSICDAHCFEITEVNELIYDLSIKTKAHWNEDVSNVILDVNSPTMFLPAQKTWIEYGNGSGLRIGYLIIENKERTEAKIVQCRRSPGSFFFSDATWWRMPLAEKPHDIPSSLTVDISNAKEEFKNIILMVFLSCALCLINTPRIIGRQQHMPHRGLERRLAKSMGLQGRFPLQAWTEIKLQVAPPKDMTDDGSHEAHLTGRKALHFCRAHLRIRMGMLEIVRSHWRGDASLGIKRSRYIVTP